MFKGFIYHTFKGRTVRSVNILDVNSIESMRVKKRIFKIIDRDCPYNLKVVYNEPKESIGISFGIIPSVYNKVDIYQEATIRYKTKEDAENDISEINNKKEKLKSMKDKLVKLIGDC